MLKFEKQKGPKGFDPSKLVKPMGKNRIIVPQLERAFIGFDDEWSFTYSPKRGDSAWHPSGHCTPSVTELYDSAVEQYDVYLHPERYTIVPGEVTGPQKNFMVGHYWHQLIQYTVVKIGLAAPEAIEREGRKVWEWMAEHDPNIPPVDRKVVPKPYHWVHGSGDIVPLVTPNWTGLVDIKTMSSYSFKGAVAGNLPPGFAFKYLTQLQIYMHLFDLEQGLILGVNKDTPHDFTELTYVRDQTLIDAILEKWYFVSECLRSGCPPTKQDDQKYLLPGQSMSD